MKPEDHLSRLEDFRESEPVGRSSYVYRGDAPRPVLWHESAHNAFYVTIDALNAFQRIQSIGGNQYSIPALGLWYLAAESFVSMHYKIAQLDLEYATQAVSLQKPPRRLVDTNKIVEKLVAVEAFYGGTGEGMDALRKQFAEFTTLRNMIFHDLTTSRQPEFAHTIFPTRVENVNEVDLLQAAIITVNVFGYFRHVFPGAD